MLVVQVLACAWYMGDSWSERILLLGNYNQFVDYILMMVWGNSWFFINYFYKPDIFLLYIPIKRPFRIILLHIYRTPRARNFICRWKRRELLHFRQCLWFLWIDRLIFYWMFILRRWWWCGDWLSIINWIHGCTHRIWVLITIICFCLVKKARLNLRRWNMFISSI